MPCSSNCWTASTGRAATCRTGRPRTTTPRRRSQAIRTARGSIRNWPPPWTGCSPRTKSRLKTTVAARGKGSSGNDPALHPAPHLHLICTSLHLIVLHHLLPYRGEEVVHVVRVVGGAVWGASSPTRSALRALRWPGRGDGSHGPPQGPMWRRARRLRPTGQNEWDHLVER